MEREANNHERGIDILYTHTYLHIIQNKDNIKQGEREREREREKKREREREWRERESDMYVSLQLAAD